MVMFSGKDPVSQSIEINADDWCSSALTGKFSDFITKSELSEASGTIRGITCGKNNRGNDFMQEPCVYKRRSDRQ